MLILVFKFELLIGICLVFRMICMGVSHFFWIKFKLIIIADNHSGLCMALLLLKCCIWSLLLVLDNTWTFWFALWVNTQTFTVRFLALITSVDTGSTLCLIRKFDSSSASNYLSRNSCRFLECLHSSAEHGVSLAEMAVYIWEQCTCLRWAAGPVLAFPRILNQCFLCSRFIEDNVLYIFQVSLSIKSTVVRVRSESVELEEDMV